MCQDCLINKNLSVVAVSHSCSGGEKEGGVCPGAEAISATLSLNTFLVVIVSVSLAVVWTVSPTP